MEWYEPCLFYLFIIFYSKILTLIFCKVPPLADALPLSDPSELENDDDDSDSEEIDNSALMPNNDFEQYRFDDFIRQADEVNVAQVQHKRKRDAWDTIKGLIGHEVECKNNTDGKVLWKHVESVTDDIFTERLAKEKEWLKKNSPMKEKIETPKELFQKMWPLDIDEELRWFVQLVKEVNKEKKKNGHRLISLVQ